MTPEHTQSRYAPTSETWLSLWRIAVILAMLAVMAGAFGAHALKERLSTESLNAFETAVRYQMFHALGLMAVCWMMSTRPSGLVTASGVCMVIGVILFSGSIYGLSLLHWRWLGPVTPLGGTILIVAWLLLLMATFRRTTSSVRTEKRNGNGT